MTRLGHLRLAWPAWLLIFAVLAVGAQRAPNQEPDVPRTGCVLYHTHTHGNGGRSYQLTCAAPEPDTIVIVRGKVVRWK